MPFAIITIGLVLIISGAMGTHKELAAQLQRDFTGPNNFLFWAGALFVVGLLGYVPTLRTFSRYFMALILIAIVISNQKAGFIERFTQAIKQA